MCKVNLHDNVPKSNRLFKGVWWSCLKVIDGQHITSPLVMVTLPYHSQVWFSTQQPLLDFNSGIINVSEKPILGMFEVNRIYLMERLRTKKEWMKKSDEICPKIKQKLKNVKHEAIANIARHSEDKRFEMKHIYSETYVVDLDKCTCTCRKWELTGLLCCHALCCISLTPKKLEEYVHKYYSREPYLVADKWLIYVIFEWYFMLFLVTLAIL